jgi:hypothetical protein
MKFDWPAANLTIFNVLLFRDAAIDQYCEMLTAVRTHDVALFQWMKHDSPPLYGVNEFAYSLIVARNQLSVKD